jgi:hypothetical protein
MTQPPPRPNTLSEEARPNVLSIGTPVATGRPGGPAPTPATAARTPATTAPTGWTQTPTRRAAQSRGNPLRGLFLFLVFVFVAIARFANLGSDFGSGPFGDQPTTAPAAEEPTNVPNNGFIDFGTSLGNDCALSHLNAVFPVGTRVYWWAHLALTQRPDQTVAWFLTFDDVEIDKGTGPSDHPTGTWDGICGDQPLIDQGSGTYRLELWEADKTVLLAAGTYELEPVSSQIASPGPSATQ